MSSSTSFNHQNVESLNLENKMIRYLTKGKTIKISDLTDCSEQKLLSDSSYNVNYDQEVLNATFNAYESWNLIKIIISFNGHSVKEHSFPDDGFSSSGLFNKIDFEFSIKDMNIQFYNEAQKNFVFDLNYQCEDEVYKTSFSMDLPRFLSYQDMEFKKQIDFYHPNEFITSFFNSNFEATDSTKDEIKAISVDFTSFRQMKNLMNRYDSYGYYKMFERMLHIEDLTIRKALDDLTMTNKLVASTYKSCQFAVYFEGKKLSDKLEFNYLVLTPMEIYDVTNDLGLVEDKNVRIYCRIISIDGSRVVFEKPRSKYISKTTKYHVQLVENRFPTRLACMSLQRISRLKMEPFFTSFDDSKLPEQVIKNFGDPVENIDSINPSIGSNVAQMKAVMNIINRTSFPSPYVIFGPPGTGKTSTLVEAVAQIVKLQPTANILVTANSNTACDEIGERLINYVPRFQIYRMYSPSFDLRFPERNKRLHPLLKPMSNMKYDINKYPSYQEFYSYNVVISTLVNCGRLITAGIAPTHFDYIFIDECASTIEPFSIIPIASLGVTSSGSMNAQVILAGDHKQLQGLVHSFFNERHGFGISLMERVMMLDKYVHPYNTKYVTQLTDNFRSHPAILKFSNFHFYHSVLHAKQSKAVADFAIGWDFLPNKSFPLIFHSILAPSEMEGTSLFNNEEVHVVASYVNKIVTDGILDKKVEPSDIGIICPYGAQRKKLQERLKGIKGLDVGTVDAFQGREKLIIIMSTVRSQTETVGFLKNEKRLNVALTRAKALLIVIGNGETLQKNKLWYKFVNYCYKNDAMIGERFMLRYRVSGMTKNVQKAHPMFQMPKVEIKNWREPQDELASDYETCDEDGINWLDEDSEDYESGSDVSDVSWTHEDFRMKAKTSKLSINARVKPEESADISDLESKLEQLFINVNDKINSFFETVCKEG